MAINPGVVKENVVHSYLMGFYSAYERRANLCCLGKWMKVQNIMIKKMNKTHKDK